MRQLTALDQQFLALEDSRQYGHVGGTRDPRPVDRAGRRRSRWPDLQDLIAERLPLRAAVPLAAGRGAVRPRLRLLDRRPGLRPRLPRPRARAAAAPATDAQLAEQVARIFARPLDRVAAAVGAVPDPRPARTAASAVMTKIHHAVIDGMSGAEIMGALLDLAPEGREPPPPLSDADRRASPGELEMLARGLAGAAALPAAAAAVAAARAAERRRGAVAARHPRGQDGRAARGDARNAPLGGGVAGRRPPGPGPAADLVQRPGLRRTAGSPSGSCRSTTSRRSRTATACTVNDVVVSICAGAVRRWLIEHDELPDEPLVAPDPGVGPHREPAAARTATGSC